MRHDRDRPVHEREPAGGRDQQSEGADADEAAKCEAAEMPECVRKPAAYQAECKPGNRQRGEERPDFHHSSTLSAHRGTGGG